MDCIYLSRDLPKKKIFKDGKLFRLFIEILFMANETDCYDERVNDTISRGNAVINITQFSKGRDIQKEELLWMIEQLDVIGAIGYYFYPDDYLLLIVNEKNEYFNKK